MIKSRLCLFEAGYSVGITLFFSHNKRLEGFIKLQEVQVGELMSQLIQKEIEELKENCFQHIEQAHQKASILRVTVPEVAKGEDYEIWNEEYTNAIVSLFPMSKIQYYYFIFAYKLAELLTILKSLNHFILIKNLSPSDNQLNNYIKNYLQDIEYILFKLRPMVVLLSAEHGHSCFKTFYQELTDKSSELKKIPSVFDSPTKTKECIMILDNYDELTNQGYNSCKKALIDLSL
jgi:hypothetical protein